MRESVERHIDVSPECREVLVSAAVLGRDFDFSLLAAVTGLDSKALLDHLDQAARTRLLTKRKDGTYAFVLPLVGDVLIQQLPASERAARHRAAAESLEALQSGALDVHAARIAYHFFRAAPVGTARQAFAYSVRAARCAEARGDARAAARQWQQATRALDLIPVSDPARLDVQLALARARARGADDEGAREAFLDAAMLARALGRPESLARGRAGVLVPGGRRRRAAARVARRGARSPAGGRRPARAAAPRSARSRRRAVTPPALVTDRTWPSPRPRGLRRPPVSFRHGPRRSPRCRP
jgi:predicted ATPase